MTMAAAEDEELAGPPVAPIEVAARLPSLDVLRGFALLGILLANIEDFSSPTGILHDIPLDVVSQHGAHHRLDVALMTAQWLFVEGKMRALFGALFGAGTALLLERIERRGGVALAADIFHRRNMWLLGFGLIHGVLIYNEDILLDYGILSLLLLYPLRHVAGRRLVVAGLLISLAGGTFGISNAMGLVSAWPAAGLQERALAARQHHRAPTGAEADAVAAAAAERHDELAALPAALAAGRGGYLHTEPANAEGEADFVALFFRSGWVLEVGGVLIAGMGLYKTGFLTARLPSRVYLATAIVGYAISVPVVLVGLDHARRLGFSDAAVVKWLFLPYGVQQIAGMLANASVLLLLVRHRAIMVLQRGLAAVGRIALSNYILTSLICQFVFKWSRLNLYGTLEYYQQIDAVLAMWAFKVVASVLWLRVFAFGRLEWAWRSLTYWRPNPWRAAARSS